MILENFNNLNKNIFSTIIIGSGPAGISLALKLDKYKIKTLLIEAGDFENKIDQKKFLIGNVNNDPNIDISNNRVRAFGGTSLLWGGYCNKFEREELENWPITYDDLYKNKKECNQILGLKDYHTDFYIKKFSENLNQYHMRFASNINFSEKYFEKIKNSQNIFLSLNTTFLNFNGNGKRIESITIKKKDTVKRVTSKFYVLACGGIENSRMLLWSKAKNNKLFNEDLPIGKYYMDHPVRRDAGDGILNYKKLIKYFENQQINRELFVDCLPRLYLSPNNKFRKKTNILNTGIYVRIKNKRHNNINYLKKLYCMAPNFIRKTIENNSSDLYNFKVRLHLEQDPNTNNKISLSNKLDPLGIPLTKIDWQISHKMKHTCKNSLVELGNFLINKDIGRLSIDENIFFEDKLILNFNGNHQIGGTCAGDDPKISVVDKNLKVHFLENLFVSGSSVFTTSGHNHPTYSIILLSLRLGDHLKKII